MVTEPVSASTTASDEAILQRAHQQYQLVDDAEHAVRNRMLEDYRFVDKTGGHWEPTEREARINDGVPTLEIDRLSGPIRQTLNQIQRSRPSIHVVPVDNGADPDKAEVRQGVIRRIETDSFADVAYLTAAEHQIKLGRGYWRILTEWDEIQPYQHIRIMPVDNPFGIYYDPRYQRPDCADARFAFVPEVLDPDDYRERFNHEPPGGGATFRGTGNAPPNWYPKGKVWITEYFDVTVSYREVQRRDGSRERIPQRHVTWYLLNAQEILDRRALPGPYLPIVPVIGERTIIDGEVDLKGIVRHAKDPQRMIDYHRSGATELLALGSKNAPVVDPESIAPFLNIWNTRNRRRWSFLPALSVNPRTGQSFPLAHMLMNDFTALQGYSLLAQQFENDLRAATGFFEVQSDERRPEQSGKAINSRFAQAELNNSHYGQHLGLGLRLTGLILNSWIPVYYDTPRQLEIVGRDDKPRSIVVHAGMTDQLQPQLLQGLRDPKKDVIDLSVGRYDIEVKPGSSQTQREATREALDGAFRAMPEVMLPLAGDLYFESFDDPVGQQIADRLRKRDPQLAEDQSGQQPIPPQVKAQMEQLGQQHAALTEIVNRQREELETNQQKIQAETQLKQQELTIKREQFQQEMDLELEKARIKATTDLQIAELQLDVKQRIAGLEAKIEQEKQVQQLAAQREMHEAELQSQAELSNSEA